MLRPNPWPVAAPATAQLGEPATRGLDTPSTPIAGDFDAFALTDNPGGLATLQGYSLTALYQDTDTTGDARRGGGGAGLYFAKPITLPLLTKLSYGAALEYLRTPGRLRAALRPGRQAGRRDPTGVDLDGAAPPARGL